MLVYIREAHAVDSRAPSTFGEVEDPITDAERGEVAHTCVESLDLPMPALIDGVDDKVGKAYEGWPDRLYLIGRDGKVAFAGARGPAGFDPNALEKAIVVEKTHNAELDAAADKSAKQQQTGGEVGRRQ